VPAGDELRQHGELRLRHIAAEEPGALDALRASKYVQSEIGDTYARAREALRSGRRVLFSGTPCQVAGLYAALGGPEKAPEHLLTVDLVCHGTPSPMVFAAYLRALEATRGQPVSTISFRDKRRGWKDFCLAATFADGSEYAAGQTEDPYLRAFLRNLCLRPSCHACPYAGEGRPADLTLADLWGAARVLPLPGLDDDGGLSLVLVGSERGQQALEAVRSRLIVAPVNAAALARDNPSIFRSSTADPRRAAFLRHVLRHGFAGVERFFAPPGLLRRAARRIAGRWARRG
jgi:coenzyme F420-reducing hydrogenase beta subunit